MFIKNSYILLWHLNWSIRQIDSRKMLPIKLKIAVIKSTNIFVLYSNSEAKEVCKNFL